MTNRHARSRRDSTGGLRRMPRKYKKYERGRDFSATTLGEHDVRHVRARGGNRKVRTKRVATVNLAANGETKAVDVKNVLENPANADYVRRDILTKGAIIETSEGTARVTSRPGQDGTVNAVLVDDEA